MTRLIVRACAALLATVLAACSQPDADANPGGMSLTSPDMRPGRPIAAEQYASGFGCGAGNRRPELHWANPPPRTRSFAITFYDRDAPTGSGFWHWLISDIPAEIDTIGRTSLPPGAREWNHDGGGSDYFGPCPPIGRKHRYTFTVHALDVEELPAPPDRTPAVTGFFINQHTLATASFEVTAGPRTAN